LEADGSNQQLTRDAENILPALSEFGVRKSLQ